jgi:hypothetical protein
MQGFAELVELFNAMTVHLPYVWKLADQQKSVYAKMDRMNAGSVHLHCRHQFLSAER